LSPGYRSRLARLLNEYAREHDITEERERIVEIFRRANQELAETGLVTGITNRLTRIASEIAGSDYSPVAVEAADPEFTRILQALRIVIPGNPVRELASGSLGYNNLLYIATVIAHLRQSPPEDTPILLIEEPEAHLHPQLAVHLGEYLSRTLVGMARPQVIVTTHSPTLVSRVHPNQITAMHARKDEAGRKRIVCSSLATLRLGDEETRQLRRFIDITRATLYFAKGLILVEGICEELLIPHLARPLGYDLAANHVSVLPLCGVSVRALRSILNEDGLAIRTAIVTDGDPRVHGSGWRNVTPRRMQNGQFEVAPRVKRLHRVCAGHPTIRVFSSDVTLEYDLAAAGEMNPFYMAACWEHYHPKGRTLKRRDVESAAPEDRALVVWRGICRAAHTASKAGFAHVLAEWLEEHSAVVASGEFAVPRYLREAFAWVCPNVWSNANSSPAVQ
jgi:putative ATP-dependent endonuclease of OLD family